MLFSNLNAKAALLDQQVIHNKLLLWTVERGKLTLVRLDWLLGNESFIYYKILQKFAAFSLVTEFLIGDIEVRWQSNLQRLSSLCRPIYYQHATYNVQTTHYMSRIQGHKSWYGTLSRRRDWQNGFVDELNAPWFSKLLI